ncbi:MAG: hypothetical protein HRU22_04220 [Gammaproteobacteria bacterium]|nr:hypothetical protein [Gammaproteobacteria bacterium]
MRKFRSKNEWLAVIKEQQLSGLSIIEFCQQHSLSTTTFYSARAKILGKASSRSTFLKATITRETQHVEVLSTQDVFRLKTRYAELVLPSSCTSQFVLEILKEVDPQNRTRY